VQTAGCGTRAPGVAQAAPGVAQAPPGTPILAQEFTPPVTHYC